MQLRHFFWALLLVLAGVIAWAANERWGYRLVFLQTADRSKIYRFFLPTRHVIRGTDADAVILVRIPLGAVSSGPSDDGTGRLTITIAATLDGSPAWSPLVRTQDMAAAKSTAAYNRTLDLYEMENEEGARTDGASALYYGLAVAGDQRVSGEAWFLCPEQASEPNCWARFVVSDRFEVSFFMPRTSLPHWRAYVGAGAGYVLRHHLGSALVAGTMGGPLVVSIGPQRSTSIRGVHHDPVKAGCLGRTAGILAGTIDCASTAMSRQGCRRSDQEHCRSHSRS